MFNYQKGEEVEGKLVMFKCGYCGEVITYLESDRFNIQDFMNKNRCHTVHIDGKGYPSECTEDDIDIPCCDKCAKKIKDKAIYWEDVKEVSYDDND